MAYKKGDRVIPNQNASASVLGEIYELTEDENIFSEYFSIVIVYTPIPNRFKQRGMASKVNVDPLCSLNKAAKFLLRK